MAMTATQEETKDTGAEEGGNSPLVDLTEAAVKKMIAKAMTPAINSEISGRSRSIPLLPDSSAATTSGAAAIYRLFEGAISR